MFYNLEDYDIEVFRDEDCFVATTLEMPTISGCGDSPEDALAELKAAFSLAQKSFLEDNEAMPSPLSRRKYSGQFSIRIPRDLHSELSKFALIEKISINQIVNYLLSKGVGELRRKS
jgi:predicted HicB family RNase H-like nuclease